MNSRFNGVGFHHVALSVKDFDKSVAFYRDVLGMNVVLSWGEAPKRATMLDIGDGTFVEIFEGGAGDVEMQGEPNIHFALVTEECDKMYEAAMAAGCKSHVEPVDVVIKAQEKDLPVHIAFVIGYDGEVIEFFQYQA